MRDDVKPSCNHNPPSPQPNPVADPPRKTQPNPVAHQVSVVSLTIAIAALVSPPVDIIFVGIFSLQISSLTGFSNAVGVSQISVLIFIFQKIFAFRVVIWGYFFP